MLPGFPRYLQILIDGPLGISMSQIFEMGFLDFHGYLGFQDLQGKTEERELLNLCACVCVCIESKNWLYIYYVSNVIIQRIFHDHHCHDTCMGDCLPKIRSFSANDDRLN